MSGYQEKYFRLLDITMNIFTVLELEKENQTPRRKVDRLLRTFKEQIEEETARLPVVDAPEIKDGACTRPI